MIPTPQSIIQTLEVIKAEDIKAPAEIVFDSILASLGPESEMGHKKFAMTFEAWPGGRWFRDLGNNTGHFWGHVQVIKPPGLLEICGPLPMSYPAVNHLQYRLKAEGSGTRLSLIHQAMGLIIPEHRDGMPEGWQFGMERIKQIAEGRAKEKVK